METETAEETSSDEPAIEQTPEVWVNLKRGTEGVSISVCKSLADGSVEVIDEAWWTWSEFTGISTRELRISRSRTTRLDAVGPAELLTVDNVWETVSRANLLPDKVDEEEAREQLAASL